MCDRCNSTALQKLIGKMSAPDKENILKTTSHFLQLFFKAQTFDFAKQAEGLFEGVAKIWESRDRALLNFLVQNELIEQIENYVFVNKTQNSIEKTLTPADKEFLQRILSDFPYMDETARIELAELFATEAINSYESAASFALLRLGAAVEFSLQNTLIRDAIIDRSSWLFAATSKQYEEGLNVVMVHFYLKGENPYTTQFLDEIQEAMGYKTRANAARFSLTETATVTSIAQFDVYEKNGVQTKTWQHLGIGEVREPHVALDGETININAAFDVNGYSAKFPRDPSLPISETINCHCDLDPGLEGIEPDQAFWSGE